MFKELKISWSWHTERKIYQYENDKFLVKVLQLIMLAW